MDGFSTSVARNLRRLRGVVRQTGRQPLLLDHSPGPCDAWAGPDMLPRLTRVSRHDFSRSKVMRSGIVENREESWTRVALAVAPKRL